MKIVTTFDDHAHFKALADLGIDVKIFPFANEMPDAIAFTKDDQARPYDGKAVLRFWRILQQAEASI